MLSSMHGKGKAPEGGKKLNKKGTSVDLAADLRALVQSASVVDFANAYKVAVANRAPGVPKGATVGKVCITLISGNLALQKKKQDSDKNSWGRACKKVTGWVTEKLVVTGLEAHTNDEFREKATFDVDTIISEMRHYHDKGIEFRLDSEKVGIIRLRLERDFGRKCNNCDLFGLGLHVDHIVPTPNDYSPDNLQLLCINCHRQKTAREQEAARAVMRAAARADAVVRAMPSTPAAA